MLMTATDDIRNQEDEVRRFVEALDLPETVERVTVRFGEDYAGDPAMYITLVVSYQQSRETTAAEVKLAIRVQLAVAAVSPGRFPYVQFEPGLAHRR